MEWEECKWMTGWEEQRWDQVLLVTNQESQVHSQVCEMQGPHLDKQTPSLAVQVSF